MDYILGADHVMWCASPRLAGITHWGSLNAAGLDAIAALGTRLLADRLPAPSLIVDLQGVAAVDAADVAAVVERRRISGRALARELFVVLPGGLRGIIIAGAIALLAPSDRPVFTSRLRDVLSARHAELAAAYDAAEQIAAEARGPGLLVARVRIEIERDLEGATVERCAWALRMSLRTMQRRLREAGTSFGDELRRARIEAARELLMFSDLKVDAVAARVGLGTASRLSMTLRAAIGGTPAQVRAEQRARDRDL